MRTHIFYIINSNQNNKFMEQPLVDADVTKGDNEESRNKVMILNLVFYVLAVAGSFLAMKCPIPGYTVNIQTIIEQYPLSIQPAGWAFAIWGIIYILLAGFAIYQAIPSKYIG